VSLPSLLVIQFFCSEFRAARARVHFSKRARIHNVNANNTRAQHKTMACTDSVSDVNNALHKADDEEAPVITLEYGPYMN